MTSDPSGKHDVPAAERWLGGGRDMELEAGSDAHYEDVRYYDATYRSRQDDVGYYLDLAEKHGGPVLEYGCGNGRITRAIAAAAIDVTGVDRSKAMLADLGALLEGDLAHLKKRITLHEADMRLLQLEQRFQLVLCTFNTWLHLYTRQDVEVFCKRVCQHMLPDATFVVDLSMPDPHELARSPARLHRVTPFRHAGTNKVVRYGERFDYDPLRQVLLVSMEFESRDDPTDRWMTPLAHRQFFPREMEALLHYNGLEVTTVHGDFGQQPASADSVDLVYHCRLR